MTDFVVPQLSSELSGFYLAARYMEALSDELERAKPSAERPAAIVQDAIESVDHARDALLELVGVEASTYPLPPELHIALARTISRRRAMSAEEDARGTTLDEAR